MGMRPGPNSARIVRPGMVNGVNGANEASAVAAVNAEPSVAGEPSAMKMASGLRVPTVARSALRVRPKGERSVVQTDAMAATNAARTDVRARIARSAH